MRARSGGIPGLVVGALVAATVGVFALLGRPGVPHGLAFAIAFVLQVAAAATAAGLAFAAARGFSGTLRVGWALIAAGSIAWIVSLVLSSPLRGLVPTTLLCSGAFLLAQRTVGGVASWGEILDQALVASVLLYIAWGVYLHDVVALYPTPGATVGSLIAPVGDLFLVAFATTAAVRGRGWFESPAWFLAAFASIGIADTLRVLTSPTASQPLAVWRAGWVVGFVLLAVAARERHGYFDRSANPRKLVHALPMGAVVLAAVGGYVMHQTHASPDEGVEWGWIPVVLIALARSALFSHEHLVASQKLEAALSASEENARQLDEAQRVGHIGSFVSDIEKGTQRGTAEARRLLWITSAELSAGKDPLTHVDPDDRKAVLAAVTRAWEHGMASGEFRVVGPQGTIRWVTGRMEKRTDRDGHAVLVGTVQDITARKTAELEGKRFQEALAQAQRIARLGSWSYDLSKGKAEWSPAAYEVAGRDPALGPPDFDELAKTYTAESEARFVAWYTKALETHKSEDIDLEIADTGSGSRWVALHFDVMRDAAGEVIGATGTVQDITPRKLAELALAKRAAHQAHLRELGAIGLSATSLPPLLEHASRIVAQALGADVVEVLELDPGGRSLTLRACVGLPGELVGSLKKGTEHDSQAGLTLLENAPVIVPDLTRETRFHPALHLVAAGILSGVTVAVRAKSDPFGVLGAHWTTRHPLDPVDVDFLENVSSIIAIAVDRNRAEAALRRSERLTSLGTLVAGVAHEINNPLTYIHGSVELIQRSARELAPALAAPQVALVTAIREDAEMAIRGLDRIEAITKGLRQVARETKGGRTRGSLNAIVMAILPVARPRMGPAIDVHLDLQSGREVMCDPNEISQVILNLLFNAADAMAPRGGGIVHVTSRDDGANVVVDVEDAGIGIPAEKRQHIFTPFYTTKASGTGLGLSVSHSIVAEHGGELTFDSVEGSGTTFHVRLPAAPSLSKKVDP